MDITPDTIVFFTIGPFPVNATIAFTWAIMLVLTIGSLAATARLATGEKVSRWQNMLEVIVQTIRDQIRDITQRKPDKYLAFLGTLYLFIAFANLLAIIPGYRPPTSSLSTTGALAVCVFVAVPFFGISDSGLAAYVKKYFKPVFFMLPLNILSEISRTVALAVRLFGNVMSGVLISAILLTIVPFFVPVVMDLFSLLIGQVHAYIFAVLAAVYIASGTRAGDQADQRPEENRTDTHRNHNVNE